MKMRFPLIIRESTLILGDFGGVSAYRQSVEIHVDREIGWIRSNMYTVCE